jgi:hypothetical protein
MKSIQAILLLTFSSVIMAADYQCFSYNSGMQVLANSDTGEIVIKDRFGNELDVITNSTTNIRILATIPETTEVLFVKNNDIVVIIQEQGDLIHGVYGVDDSYQCRMRKPAAL